VEATVYGASEPQLAPYKPGEPTSGIFKGGGYTIELKSGFDGPTLNLPKESTDFDTQTNDRQLSCSKVGDEFCVSGKVYRCEKTGSEITAIFQNESCDVFAGTWQGQGHQTPAKNAAADWSIVMTIQGGGAVSSTHH
jgi:hypothetical protein